MYKKEINEDTILFNKARLLNALKYKAKKERYSFARFVKDKGIHAFCVNYLYRTSSIPTLKTIYTFCKKQGLNPRSFIFNNESFNPRKDFKVEIKNSGISYSEIIPWFLSTMYNIWNSFKERSGLNILYTVLNDKHVVLTYKGDMPVAPVLYFHFILKGNTIYSLHDRLENDIDNINKEYLSGYTKFSKDVFKTYLNFLYIEHLNYKKL